MNVTSEEYDAFLNTIPDIDVYQQSLDDFLKIDLSNASDAEIKAAYDKHIKLLVPSYMFIPNDEFNQMTFYRVRNLPLNSITEDISLISTYSYPLHIHSQPMPVFPNLAVRDTMTERAAVWSPTNGNVLGSAIIFIH